ncbi:MAG TPA: DUF362 domain-containing protein [Acidobacteriota bacterium]|nr:DUF362 domain-containing protein [Acidobacteriota bacterium]
MDKQSTVAVVSVSDSVQDAVRSAMELASWKSYVDQGKPTALKVNLGWDLFIPGSITSPWVIEGVIETIRDWVGPLYLIESDQVLENIERAFQKCRLQQLCDKWNVRWINMSQLDTHTVAVPKGKIFLKLEIPKILLETQMITIPVMKTHAKTQITGALKNQWGCISKLRHNYHLVLNEALADINSVVKPVFAVMDATIALEGNGPKSGSPKIVNKILASHDPVALDTVQAKLMGLNPDTIPHLQECASRCLGTNDLGNIQWVGDSDAADVNLHFRPARHNIVSRIEEICRKSRLKKLVFDTPLFWLMLIGAKAWYLAWFYLFMGRKHWRTVLQHPLYGKEWQSVRRKDS